MRFLRILFVSKHKVILKNSFYRILLKDFELYSKIYQKLEDFYDQVLDYNGDRTVEAMSEYIDSNGEKVSGGDPDEEEVDQVEQLHDMHE